MTINSIISLSPGTTSKTFGNVTKYNISIKAKVTLTTNAASIEENRLFKERTHFMWPAFRRGF